MVDKKDRILYAAMEVFREKGIEKSKVSDIVKAAGIAQGTFYLYFPSKISVMPYIAQKMVNETVERLQEKIPGEENLIEQLRWVIQIIFQMVEQYRDIFPFVFTGLKETNYLREWEEIYLPYYEWMSSFLQKYQKEGVIRSSIDSQRTAKIIIGMIEATGEQNYWYDSPKEGEVAQQKEELLQFLKAGLGIHG